MLLRAVFALSVGAALVAPLVAPLAAPLGAQEAIANRAFGFSTSEPHVRTLPFALATNFERIDDVLAAAHGVTFINTVFLANPVGDAYPVPNGAATIGFAFPTGGAITMSFGSLISGIAFQAFAQFVPDVSETRFEAFAGSTLLSSFAGRPPDPLTLRSTESLKWWGFEGGAFDRVVITAPTARNDLGEIEVWGLGLTNITIADLPAAPVEVPEPGALVLLAAGMIGVVRRRYCADYRTRGAR